MAGSDCLGFHAGNGYGLFNMIVVVKFNCPGLPGQSGYCASSVVRLNAAVKPASDRATATG
jgi:hypothetical protein